MGDRDEHRNELAALQAELREARRTIEALQAERSPVARLRAMLDRSTEAITLNDATGSVLEAYGAVERILGRRVDDIVGDSGIEWFHPDDRESVFALLSSVLEEPSRSVSAELRIIRPDGSLRWVDLAATNLLEVPEVRAIVASFRDVTERHDAAHALRETDAQYRRVFEAAPEPIVVHIDGVIAFANAATARALGLPDARELVGRSMTELAHGPTRELMAARIAGHAAVSEDGMLPVVEQELRRADGRIMIAEVTTTRFVFAGRPAAVSVAHDVTERKRAEDAIRAASLEADLARRRLEAVLDALPVAVWIADPTGRVVHMNAAVSAIYGFATAASSIDEYGVYRARWESNGEPLGIEDWALTRTLRTGVTIVAEPLEIERPDGTRRHVLNSSAPIRGADGRIEGGVAVVLDVSERFEAERERERLIATLEFERKRLGTLLERAPAFIAVLRGPDHVFELANEAYHTLVGNRELVGRRFVDAMPEVEAQGFVTILDRVLRTSEPFVGTAMPVVLRRENKSETRYLNVVYQPVVEADGTCSGVFSHGVDVTEQVLVARRVRAQFEALPTPTLVFQSVVRDDGTPDFLFVDHNEAATRLTPRGIGPLGTYLSAFLPTETPIADAMRQVMQDGKVVEREVAYRFQKGGETRRFIATLGAIPPDLVVLFADDITDRVALEEQLRQSQKMEAIGRLAGGIAHDFNNLLSVILSYTAFVLDDLAPDSEMREDIEQVHKAGERAVELTRQLLTFSRQQLLSPHALHLHECVSGIERMLRRVIGEDIELSLITTDTGTVHADPAQLDLVLMNLAVNARDAMPTGGTITLRTSDVELDEPTAERLGLPPGSYVSLSVSDTGVGMSAATRARVFEPFFTTKEVGKGTGLGLATAFGIIRQSRGTITVESEPGCGAKFTIHLPRVEPSPASERPVTEHVPAAGSETILLVDDDEGVREAAHSILARAGYVVLVAQTVGDAILLAEQHPGTIDLLVTDVVMPRMSGPQLADRLAALRPDMRVLLVSGYAGDAMRNHGVGATRAFLQKPITPASLVSKIREVLDAP